MKNEKEKFLKYLKVQMSGRTNMFDVKTVCALSGGILTKEDCIYIMENYDSLEAEHSKN